MPPTRDLRIERIRPLIAPAILSDDVPLSEAGSLTVSRARAAIVRTLAGEDDRLLVVVGPRSVHDEGHALEYGVQLRALAEQLQDDLLIVMRVFFEEPVSGPGWRGLIDDPAADGSYAINEGLHRARGLLVQLAEAGMPAGTEFLDPITPQFIADVVTWGAIGARTTESQVHRELASGLSMPVGFKNGTGGSVQLAVDAVVAAAYPHVFLGVTEQGIAGIVSTRGNPDCHIILRGGKSGPNYGPEPVAHALEALRRADVAPRLMIDPSHANSNKDHTRQPLIAREVAAQVAVGQRGIVGVLMESFLAGGRQDLGDPARLTYGQSVTDACLAWDDTVPVLQELAGAVRQRRLAAG